MLNDDEFIEKLGKLNPCYDYSDSFEDGGEWKRQNKLHQELCAIATSTQYKLLTTHMKLIKPRKKVPIVVTV